MYQTVALGLCHLPGRAYIGLEEGQFYLMPMAFVSFLKEKALKVSAEAVPQDLNAHHPFVERSAIEWEMAWD